MQLIIPLRHLAITGDVAWTEEGHRFAWRMKLRHKEGTISFLVTRPRRATTEIVDPASMLTPRQVWKMTARPDMIWQFARHLGAVYGSAGELAQVRAQTAVSLNGRPPAALVDPSVDLAAAPQPVWTHASWILPLPPELEPTPCAPRTVLD